MKLNAQLKEGAYKNVISKLEYGALVSDPYTQDKTIEFTSRERDTL